jgi:hypothetical protein
MAAWNDLRQYIRSHYQVADQAPGVIRQVPSTLGADRTKMASLGLNCGGSRSKGAPDSAAWRSCR